MALFTLVAVLALALGVALSNRRANQDSQAALDLLARKRSAVDSGVRHLEMKISADERYNENIRAAIAHESALPARTKSAFHITLGRDPRSLFAILNQNPRLYALGMKAYTAAFHINMEKVYRPLNLSPDQITKFDALGTQDQEARLDILSTAASQGLALDDPAVKTLMQQENTQFEANIKSLLGDTAFQQYQQVSRMQGVASIAFQAASSVSLTETPLLPAQADQLLQIMANACPQYQSGGVPTPNTVNWPAALAQAQGILTPVQYQALQAAYSSFQINQLKAQFDRQEKGK